MRTYHRTFQADAILRDGFKDSTGTYLTDREHTGVWLSDRPLDINEGADGDRLLSIDIPEEVFRKWEEAWEESGKPYREALIPAQIVNSYGPPSEEFE